MKISFHFANAVIIISTSRRHNEVGLDRVGMTARMPSSLSPPVVSLCHNEVGLDRVGMTA